MQKVAIVTDSTAYLSAEQVALNNITVLPLSIIWEGKSYRDGVDMQPAKFYERLSQSKALPTTSQVTAPAIQEAFSALLEQGHDVLGMFVSSKLSGTFESAVQARKMMQGAQEMIALVDSELTTVAMALPLLAAAKAACAGEGLQGCKAIAERARDQSGVLFVVETLEFMRRGGRIGDAQAFLGTALSIKPLLGMSDGRIIALEKVRRKSAALNRMLEIVIERVGDRAPVHIATSHANAEVEAEELLQTAAARMQPVEAFTRPLSPVIGSHVGPGTVALAYMAGIG
ncbi:MAG TPA: DegV family protein [Anaerolineales bacterium]|nr:DegV family protein [Anaerolineales bacterium]